MSYPRYMITDDGFDADVINGKVWHADGSAEAVADDGYINFLVQTNSTVSAMKTRVVANTAGAAYLTITEVGSINVAGGSEPVRNLNRIVGDGTFTGSVTDAASVSGGTGIFESMWGAAGGGPNAAGGANQFFFVLAPNAAYEFKLQNISGGAAILDLELFITEVN